MEKTKNIYQRILQVMSEVTYVQKESKKVNGAYTFVSHDAVTAALHMPMTNAGIVMVPTVLELTQDGNRTVVKMSVNFINADDPHDQINVIHYGYGIDTQDKGIGKAISYAVKYALLKMFCLETGDDAEKDQIPYESSESIALKDKALNDYMQQKEDEKLLKKFLNQFKESEQEVIKTLVNRYQIEQDISVKDLIDRFKKDLGSLNTYIQGKLKDASSAA